MRIVRTLEERARLAVAAGFRLGARPAELAPSQRELFSTLTQRAFAGVLEQAARAGCQAFVCGGELFSDALPSLEHVRTAMAPLGSARRAGMTIIATDEQPGQATDGTSFLAEVGLIDSVLNARGPASVMVSAANLQIALVTGGASGDLTAADLILALKAPSGDDLEPAAPASFADVVIDTCAPHAPCDRSPDMPVIETGWAGPSLERERQPGFVILDIDPRAGVIPTFVETEALRSERLAIDSPKAGGEVEHVVAPHLGATDIVDVELRGRISRSVWHDINPAGLIELAAAAGTLLRFDIDRLVVDEFNSQAGTTERASFLVNARRVSDGLASAASDESQRDLVAAARARVVEIAGRREPAEVIA
ncbi:MAG: hypothetical protein OXR64_00840 [Chloroflexota bacterium]|nr:hypothetical protein [Chloroflexota bacterium]MDE2918374.1 hypothetical protein [Chloroflexota bacterium]